MTKINVKLGKRGYPIYVGIGLMKHLRKLVPAELLRGPVLVVTNKTVRRLFGNGLVKSLKPYAGTVAIKEIPDSEKAKSLKVYADIITALARLGQKAKPTIIALGGGVVGDVAGFAASTYRRGIPYIQVPTTLLAQVDSSIGGKVAIDLPQAKNLVGNFYQPRAVIADLSVLRTLPDKEVRNGIAEIVKYGVISDPRLFVYLERNMKRLVSLRRAPVEYVVRRCASIKAGIVSRDEHDTEGIRVVLNFGHTFAHAIETHFSYSKRCTHGESVAIGMAMACHMALKLTMVPPSAVRRVVSVLRRAGLPTKVSVGNVSGMIEAIALDKKFRDGTNRFVLPRRIGAVITVENIPELLVKDVLTKGGL